MRSSIFLAIVFIFCFGTSLKAQNDVDRFKALFTKTENYYKDKDSYVLKVNYAFFEQENASKAQETMDGAIQKKGTNYYSKIGPTEQIYLEDTYLKINHQEKAVLYKKITAKKSMLPLEITSMLDSFDCIEVMQEQGNYVCNLSFMEIEMLPYKKMVLVIDSTTFAIKRQELHMIEGKTYPSMAASTQKTTAGKMVITFSEQTKEKITPALFKKSNYITEGKTIALSRKLASYTLYNTTK